RALAALLTVLADEEPFDLIIAGMAAADSMTSMLPAALAAALGLPLVSQARELNVDVEHSWLRASRSVDGVDESLEAPFPAVLSVSDQLNEPRFPGFKDLKAARMKPLVRAELDDIAECDPSGVLSSVLASGFDAMPLRVESIEEHQRGGSGEVFPDTGDGGKRLAEFIEEKLK
ncbi:MAG: electron transfer flavoprotein beta subunit/FixA family protein, partial [Actinomyces sp.]|nr:electron transfer flavoprotein beta subunit/FixA family protein [Actinomyces sp.]